MVRPIMVALITANLVNGIVNWVLIFGHLGFPAHWEPMAPHGRRSRRACSSRAALAAIIAWHERRAAASLFATPLGIEAARLWRLVKLGFPAAMHLDGGGRRVRRGHRARRPA